MLADPDHKVVDAYGVPVMTHGEMKFAARDTFLISPDGKIISYEWQDPDHMGERPRFLTVSIDGGPVIGSFERMIGGGFPTWSPDSKAIDYPVTRGGISDVWRQPLTGGPAKQLTHFSSDQISNVNWSGDGKTLAAARGTRTADIILLKSPSKPQ